MGHYCKENIPLNFVCAPIRTKQVVRKLSKDTQESPALIEDDTDGASGTLRVGAGDAAAGSGRLGDGQYGRDD